MPLRFFPSRPQNDEPRPEVVWSIDGWPPQIVTPSFGEDEPVADESDSDE